MKTCLLPIDDHLGDTIICSLPMPPFDCDIRVEGASRTQAIPLGEWPARAMADAKTMWPWPEPLRQAPRGFGNPPRRCLVEAVFPDTAPSRIVVELLPGQKLAAPGAASYVKLQVVPGPEEYHKKGAEGYHYVKREDALRLNVNGKGMSLALAMRVGGELRRWQWVEIIPVWSGGLSSAYVVGGHIYAGEVERRMTMAEFERLESTSFFQERSLCAKAFVTVHATAMSRSRPTSPTSRATAAATSPSACRWWRSSRRT